MALVLFLLINLFVLVSYYQNKINLFFTGLLVLLFVEPIFQKLTDPTLHGITFHIFGIDRIKTNLIIIISFLVIILFPNRHQALGISRFVVCVVTFHLFNVLFSVNPQNSLALFIVSVVLPILLYKVLMSINLDFYKNEKIIQCITLAVVFFILLGIMMYNQNPSEIENSELVFNRTGGGLWLSNISTQVLSVFYPFLLIKTKHTQTEVVRITALTLFLVLLVTSLSRTAAIVYLIMTIYFAVRVKNKFSFLLMGLLFLSLLNYVAVSQLQIDVMNMYSERFQRSGTIMQTIETDTRLVLYEQSLQIIKENNLWIGSGISTFNRLNDYGFSNAHNIFFNILVERGIIGLLLVIFFFLYFFKKINYLLEMNITALDQKIITSIKAGVIGFIFIGLSGNDLFINSGFINSWPISCLVICLAIVENKILIYKRYEENYKKNDFYISSKM